MISTNKNAPKIEERNYEPIKNDGVDLFFNKHSCWEFFSEGSSLFYNSVFLRHYCNRDLELYVRGEKISVWGIIEDFSFALWIMYDE